jgi:hypothetical protein
MKKKVEKQKQKKNQKKKAERNAKVSNHVRVQTTLKLIPTLINCKKKPWGL